MQQSLKICQKQNNPRQQSIIYYNLGIIAAMLGGYAQARQYLDKAVEFSYDLNDKVGMVSIVVEQGKLAVALGQYSQAIQTIQKGLALLEEIGSKWNIEAMLACLGLAFRLQGDLAESERLLQQSLASAQAINHPIHTAASLSHLGCLAFDRGHYRQAEQYQQQALTIWQKLKHEPEMASGLRYLAHTAAASAEEGGLKAGEYYRQALRLALTHHLAPLALDLFAGMAGLLAQARETQRAVELLAQAEHHPASTQETRDRARRRLHELEKNGLSPEIVMAAKARAETISWEALAVELLQVENKT